MILVKESDRYLARASFQERHVLKESGFWWSPEDKAWWTAKESCVETLQSKVDVEIVEDQGSDVDLPDNYDGHPSCALDGPDDIPCPPGLAYRPFQRGGIAYARGRDGALIADEMGLGKTIQAIGIMNDQPIENALIICPATLKLNWEAEIDKWLNYWRKVAVVGPVWDKGRHIYIINYDVLKKHKKEIDAVEWDILVCDEAQYLKNPDAIRTKMTLGCKKKGIKPIRAKQRIFLSGTPIENKPIEIFPIANSLAPDVFPSRYDFALRYCAGFMGPWGLDATGASNLAELQFKLRESCMIRRMKKDVLKDLPDKEYQNIVFPAVGKDRAAVDHEMREYERSKRAMRELTDKCDLNTVEGREQYEKQKAYLLANLKLAREKTTKVMLPMAMDYLETAMEGGKVIVFCYHKFVMQELSKRFAGKSVMINGSTPNPLRKKAVEKFQNDEETLMFIGQIKAAGVGITLTASSHVVFVERDYNPGRMNQAEDRAHRIGQKNNVLITHCLLADSYDQEMMRKDQEKRESNNKALNAT